ncbi:MAG: hypothetical protein ACLP19_02940, partial [Xanthobacteraceae bacterium]
IAVVAAVSINASTKATALEATVTETAAIYRDPVAAETAVSHREPVASETATAKAVTSKTSAMASTTAMASAATTASSCERCAGRRCCYAEHDGGSCCNHLFAHFSKTPVVSFNMDSPEHDLCSGVAVIGSQLHQSGRAA